MSTPESPVDLSVAEAIVPSNEILGAIAYSQSPEALRPGLTMWAAVCPPKVAKEYMTNLVMVDGGFSQMLQSPETVDYELSAMTLAQSRYALDADRLLVRLNVALGAQLMGEEAEAFFEAFDKDRDEGSPLTLDQVAATMDALGGYDCVGESLKKFRSDRQARIDTLGTWIGVATLDQFMTLFGTEALLQVPPDEQDVVRSLVRHLQTTSMNEKNRLVDAIDSDNYASKGSQLARAIANIDSALGCVMLHEDWRAFTSPKTQAVIERVLDWRQGYARIQEQKRIGQTFVAELELDRQVQTNKRNEKAIQAIQAESADFIAQHTRMIEAFAPLSGKKLRASKYWGLFSALTGHAPVKDAPTLKPALDKITASEWIGSLEGLRVLTLNKDDTAIHQDYDKLLEDERSVLEEFRLRASALQRHGRRVQASPSKALASRFAELGSHWAVLERLLHANLDADSFEAFERLALLLQASDDK